MKEPEGNTVTPILIFIFSLFDHSRSISTGLNDDAVQGPVMVEP